MSTITTLEKLRQQLNVVNEHFIVLDQDTHGYRPFNTDVFTHVVIGIFTLEDGKIIANAVPSQVVAYSVKEGVENIKEQIRNQVLEGVYYDTAAILSRINTDVSLETKYKTITNNLIALSTFDKPKKVKQSKKQFTHTLDNVPEEDLIKDLKDFILSQSPKDKEGNLIPFSADDIKIKFYHIKQYRNNLFSGLLGTKDYIKNLQITYPEDYIEPVSKGGYTVGIVTIEGTTITFLISSQCLNCDTYSASLGRKTALRSIVFNPSTINAMDVGNYQGDNLTDSLLVHVLSDTYQRTFNSYIPMNTEQKVFS